MKGYVYHYAFQDGGRGDSPWLDALDGDDQMRTFLAERLDWLPEPLRAGEVDAFMATLTESGTLEVRMEDHAEELVNEGKISWDDVPELDTEAELRVNVRTTGPDHWLDPLKQRLMR